MSPNPSSTDNSGERNAVARSSKHLNGFCWIYFFLYCFCFYTSLCKSPFPSKRLHPGLIIQGVSKESVISKLLTFCVIALVLLSSQKYNWGFHTIELIVVILNIIVFLSSKLCPRYENEQILLDWLSVNV